MICDQIASYCSNGLIIILNRSSKSGRESPSRKNISTEPSRIRRHNNIRKTRKQGTTRRRRKADREREQRRNRSAWATRRSFYLLDLSIFISQPAQSLWVNCKHRHAAATEKAYISTSQHFSNSTGTGCCGTFLLLALCMHR